MNPHEFLCSQPEIHDDASTFQEIREIFKVYDADGTGGWQAMMDRGCKP